MIWCTMHYLSFYGFSGLPWWIISPNVIQTTIWFIIFNHSSPTCILWIYQILIIKGHCIHNLIVCPTKNEFSNIVLKKSLSFYRLNLLFPVITFVIPSRMFISWSDSSCLWSLFWTNVNIEREYTRFTVSIFSFVSKEWMKIIFNETSNKYL